MLEVRNLVKVYKPKKGSEVRALNDVSIKFPEKGLVFILGKSGCGKSTLLNMLGGLDRVDSGEIIIKGKSSKDFTQADFDSYRNTYLGFIFQEYNILNEFTVGANVGLALELQGKKATKEAINDILAQVELQDYASRKPMQLSGGQKQRIAIARALVKNPEIILADEPTGALDSKTGIQVFDTLKELSKDKLVIVVSHDREFAESYGDRVIELKDGQVISDIEKYIAESDKKNDAISVIDNKIIQIKKGYELTKEDVQMINDYLKKNNAIVSIDETSNRDLKKFARIDDSGNKECFKDTDEDEIVYERRQKFRLIKSRLPFKDSFKIGASGLKAKPVRLIISILLSLVAFTLFGLADTINAYNKYTATVDSLLDSKVKNISFEKEIIVDNGDYEQTGTMELTEEDIAKINKKTGQSFAGVYSPNSELNFSRNVVSSIDYMELYQSSAKGFIESSTTDLEKLKFTLTGSYPATNDEIAISEYAYRMFKEHGYKRSDNSEIYDKDNTNLDTKEKFLAIHPTIDFDGKEYEVVGIIDTNFNYSHFNALSQEQTTSAGMVVSYILVEELKATVLYGYHGQIFVKKGFIDDYQQSTNIIGMSLNNNSDWRTSVSISYYKDNNVNPYSLYIGAVLNQACAVENGVAHKFFYGDGSTTLKKNDILIDMNNYASRLEDLYNNSGLPKPEWLQFYGLYDREVVIQHEIAEELLPLALANGWTFGYWDYYSWHEEDASSWSDEQKLNNLYTYLNEYESNIGGELPTWVVYHGYRIKRFNLISNYVYNKARNELLLEQLNSMTSFDSLFETGLVRTYSINLYNKYEENTPVTIAGVFCMPISEDQYLSDNSTSYTYALIDDTMYSEISDIRSGKYAFAIAPMVEKESELKSIVKWSYDNSSSNSTGKIHFALRAGPTELLGMVNNVLENMSEVFLYVGLAFAVFAGLLMMNYIATTISYKKRDIGILRAVGARSFDVFGIFFNESLIIALINFLLSSIATFGFVFYINNMLRSEYNITLTILNFGLRQTALILLLAVGVAAISSAIPVYNIARKKPIDAIRSI